MKKCYAVFKENEGIGDIVAVFEHEEDAFACAKYDFGETINELQSRMDEGWNGSFRVVSKSPEYLAMEVKDPEAEYGGYGIVCRVDEYELHSKWENP